MIEPDAKFEHLVAETFAWAEDNGHDLDSDWLMTALQIYAQRIDSPTSWPKGSVTDLVARYLPAYGSGAAPDPLALKATLTTYWRYLKGAQLFAPGSAQPSKLAAELQSAMPQLFKRWDDRRFWSQPRVMEAFAESLGITFGDASTQQELQSRVEPVYRAWNAMSQEERWQLMPERHPDAAQPPFSGSPAAFLDQDDEGAEDDYDEDFDSLLSDAEVDAMRARDFEQVAADIANAEFTTKCQELADWVGEGRAVTATGVLRPAVAREAIKDLGLHDPFRPDHEWRSASEYYPLDKLWRGCIYGDQIEVTGSKAIRHEVGEDLDLFRHAIMRTVPLFLDELADHQRALFSLLLTLIQVPHGEGVPLDELYEGHAQHRADELGDAVAHESPGIGRLLLDVCVSRWGDVGLYTQKKHSISVTEFGRAFIFTLIDLDADGVIDLEAELS